MRRKIIFICLVSAIGISGCGKQPTMNVIPSSAKKEVSSQIESSSKGERMSKNGNDFATHFNEFTIDGTPISLPCSYQELIDAGFKMYHDYHQEDELPKDGLEVTEWHWKSDEETTFEIGFAPNTGKEAIPLKEGIAVTIKWEPNLSDLESEVANKKAIIDFTLYGGINADSSMEDVAKVLDKYDKYSYGKSVDDKFAKCIMIDFSMNKKITLVELSDIDSR